MTPKSRRAIPNSDSDTLRRILFNMCIYNRTRHQKIVESNVFMIWADRRDAARCRTFVSVQIFFFFFFVFVAHSAIPSNPRNYKLYLFHRVFHRSLRVAGDSVRWMHGCADRLLPICFSPFFFPSNFLRDFCCTCISILTRGERKRFIIRNMRRFTFYYRVIMIVCMIHTRMHRPSTSVVRSFGRRQIFRQRHFSHEHMDTAHFNSHFPSVPKHFSAPYIISPRENNWDGFTVPRARHVQCVEPFCHTCELKWCFTFFVSGILSEELNNGCWERSSVCTFSLLIWIGAGSLEPGIRIENCSERK